MADSAADTLTLVAGTGITLTTNAGTDTITITDLQVHKDPQVRQVQVRVMCSVQVVAM